MARRTRRKSAIMTFMCNSLPPLPSAIRVLPTSK
jgi:hypothetical protein